MKKLIILLLFIPAFAFSQKSNKDWAQIQMVLEKQSQAWNKGDIEGYMQGYWNSPDLKFIGKNGITMGWQGTLERYKKSYPDKQTMGNLSFELLHHEPIGKQHYQVIGQWKLLREKDILEGHFTLLWKKINGKWYVISDHSS
jgi:ketosteroid isomerase-like protein